MRISPSRAIAAGLRARFDGGISSGLAIGVVAKGKKHKFGKEYGELGFDRLEH
jgi:hypothetical protein